jgi:hypothetical protein
MRPVRFDASTSTVRFSTFAREPAKVIRYTYSIQKGALANIEQPANIPKGFLRSANYVDVTRQYWPVRDIQCKLYSSKATPKIAYCSVFNDFDWQPTWWGKVERGTVTFSNMCKGAAFLPVSCVNGKMRPAGYIVLSGYNNEMTLIPDTIHKRTVTITEQDQYLLYRPGKKYTLFYWNDGWCRAGEKTANNNTKQLVFTGVPRDVLLILVPEYSQHKERPFVITDENKRLWW